MAILKKRDAALRIKQQPLEGKGDLLGERWALGGRKKKTLDRENPCQEKAAKPQGCVIRAPRESSGGGRKEGPRGSCQKEKSLPARKRSRLGKNPVKRTLVTGGIEKS